MASTQTADPLQTAAWEPPYSQMLLLSEDLLVINIQNPKTMGVEAQINARQEMVDQTHINYFDRHPKYLEHRRKRYPFFYQAFREVPPEQQI